MSDITKTPKEELECEKKYLYEYSMFWECNDGSKSQILEDDVCKLLNEQQSTINKQNELINLIADACIFSKEYSVKEILRKEIEGIDTVTYESARAWHDYVILSEFFKEHYKEHWDNE